MWPRVLLPFYMYRTPTPPMYVFVTYFSITKKRISSQCEHFASFVLSYIFVWFLLQLWKNYQGLIINFYISFGIIFASHNNAAFYIIIYISVKIFLCAGCQFKGTGSQYKFVDSYWWKTGRLEKLRILYWEINWRGIS